MTSSTSNSDHRPDRAIDPTLLRDVWHAYGWAAPGAALFLAFAASVIGSAFLAETWTQVLLPPAALLFPMLVAPRFRKMLPHALAFLMGVTLIALVGEVAFRLRYFGTNAVTNPLVYAPMNPVPTGEHERLNVLSENTRIGYDMQPGYAGWHKGAPIKFNSQGYRGGDFSIEKPPGVFRIVLLGDSFVMGPGVSLDDNMSAVIERSLNDRCDRPIEVLNLGVRGMDMNQIAGRLERDALRYEPDLILVGFRVSRVLERSLGPSADWEEILEKDRALTESFTLLRRHGFVLNVVPSYRDLWRIVERKAGLTVKQVSDGPPFEAVVDEMRRMCARAGVPLALAPVRLMDFEGSTMEDDIDTFTESVHRRVRQTGRQLGVPVIDTFDAIPPDVGRLDYVIFPGDGHLNETAHEAVGIAIADGLINSSMVPCESSR